MTGETMGTELRGPVARRADGRLVPNPARPASMLSQSLLLEQLASVADRYEGELLDIGCGARPYEWIYRGRVRSAVGCDWPAGEGTAVHPDVVADAVVLPFRSASFDTVLCTEVLEHVPEPEACVAELSRVLRPGGYLILTTPFFYWLHEQPRDFFRFTPFALERLATRHGLVPVHLAPRGDALAVVLDLWGKWCHRLLRGLARRGPVAAPLVSLGRFAYVVPQRAYLRLRRASSRGAASGALSARALGDVVALGYVIVARREAGSAIADIEPAIAAAGEAV